MNHQPLRVGIIGLGFMGRNHLRVYTELDGVEVVAVADVDDAVLARASRGRTSRPYLDYRAMLREERLDAVSIVTPTRLHREVALVAIAAGVNILIEKPIAPTVSEALEIEEAARGAAVKVTVGHVERFNPAVAELKRRLKENALGRLYQVQARRVGPFPQRIRDVGVVHDLATHDVDVMRFVLGTEITRLHARVQRGIRTEHEDSMVAVLEFEDDVLGLLDVNWLSPVKVRQLLALGAGGMFSLDYVRQELFHYQERSEANDWPDFSAAGLEPELVTKLRVRSMEPLRAELESFVGCVVGQTEPAVTCAEAIMAVHVADKLLESALSGQALDMSNPLRTRLLS